MGCRNNNGCCGSEEEEILGVEDRNRSCRCFWKGFERGFVQGVNCANNSGCGCGNNCGCRNGCGF